MSRPLKSDELGHKGESKLSELLVDARLIANKPDRDRLGWDSVISWPFNDLEALDSRTAPLACHLQLKTLWAGNDTISLNLATLEYIVKDPRPAFILALEVDDPGLSFVRAHIIHIAGDFLGEILKRLRRARITPKRSGALEFEPSISKWGTKLPAVTGAALKSAMEAAAPGGLEEYGNRKRRELSELGFERGAMQLSTTIEAASDEELIDGFLGLKFLRILDASQVETRFEIPIELPDLPWDKNTEGAALKLMPKRTDRCTILVERGEGDCLEMKGELFLVPQRLLGKGRMVLEARAALARIRLDVMEKDGANTSSITFASLDRLGDIKATAADWGTFFRLSAWSIRDPITVTIKAKRFNAPPPIIGAVDPDPDDAEARRYEKWAESAEAVEWAMVAAQAPDTKFTWAQLAAAAPDLLTLRTMKLAPHNVPPLSFVTSGTANGPPLPEYDMLYVNSVPLGEKRLAFAARTRVSASLEKEGISWVTGPMQLEMVRKIKDCEKALRKFAHDAQKFTGMTNYFGLRLEP